MPVALKLSIPKGLLKYGELGPTPEYLGQNQRICISDKLLSDGGGDGVVGPTTT